MNTDILHYIENLEEHAHQANAYVEVMKKKTFQIKKRQKRLEVLVSLWRGNRTCYLFS